MVRENLCVRHLVVSVGPKSFGLGSVALNLVREQLALGIDSGIWCLDSPEEVARVLRTADLPSDCVVAFKPVRPRFLGHSPELQRAATGLAGRKVHVIHQHGIWTGLSRVANNWRRTFHRPTVIAPHGSLEAWALRRSSWKKRIALAAYEAENLRNAACFHATAQPEVDGFIRYGVRRPIALVPNGVADAWIDSVGDGARFRLRHGLKPGVKILLYMGRITPVKNLAMLLEAMAIDRGALNDWLLVIAGTDEFGYKRKLECMIGRLQLEEFVRFVGFVPNELKRDAYAAANVFVLPSRREASPISVLEALGAGVPVLTTHGAPWRELETYRCGWWCEVDVAAITEALGMALRLSSDRLAVFGDRGRQLVRKSYTWSRVASECERLYAWLLGTAAQPESIIGQDVDLPAYPLTSKLI
jgi:glycosyltransferase involved in cell wall biosynthesis